MSNQTSDNNKRIAKNTGMLYVRMLFMMVISLYTSRITLNALGVVDYGIYNVIGGVVATMAFVKTTLSSAAQRFITFELGRNNMESLKKVFSNILSIHLIFGGIVLLVGETLGVWFLNTQMNIPSDRMMAANVVLQCSLGIFILTLMNVPYNGLIIAHERMNAFAYISILEVVLKLLIVYALLIVSVDKLILYSFLWLCTFILIQFVYFQYSFKNFSESRIRPQYDRRLCKKMLGFSGYNLCEVFANMLADQGLNILLNLHFGPAINAARGIAVQVNGAINGFTTNFITAVNPQITKSYASGDSARMWTLVNYGNRLAFFLLLFLATPVFFKIDYILEVWLKTPPVYCAIFIQMMILINLNIMPKRTFYTAVSATGDIKRYQISFGLFRLLVFPACWIVLNYISSNPNSVYVVLLAFEIIGTAVSMKIIKDKMPDFSILNYIKVVLWPCTYVFCIVFCVQFFFSKIFSDNLGSLILYAFLACIINAIIIYVIGLNKKEKNIIHELIKRKVKK